MLEPHEYFIGIHAINIANAKNESLILKDTETGISQGVITRAMLRWM